MEIAGWRGRYTFVTRATDDGREDGAGSVVTGEAGLAHS
jgi:hypothetical protein